MKNSEEIVRDVVNAHHGVVNAEIALARDEDSPMHFNWALRKTQEADRLFKEATDALREHLKTLEGNHTNA